MVLTMFVAAIVSFRGRFEMSNKMQLTQTMHHILLDFRTKTLSSFKVLRFVTGVP